MIHMGSYKGKGKGKGKGSKYKARFGGCFKRGGVPTYNGLYDDIGYVFIDLPTGERMQLFYNAATRLFVADVSRDVPCGHSKETLSCVICHNTGTVTYGNEFVRCTVPEAVSSLMQHHIEDAMYENEADGGK